MSDKTLKKSEITELLKHAFDNKQLERILRSLPSMIPYIGNAYSSATTGIQLEAVNNNIERILKGLKANVSNNMKMINKIISQVNKHRHPEFILNSDIAPGHGTVEHLLNFTLSNTGGSIIHVRKIWLELLSTKECKELHPSFVMAMMDEYKYYVNLSLTTKNYLLDDKSFSYKNGDIDKFVVGIDADTHMFYYFQIFIEYCDVRHHFWSIARSPVYSLHFEGDKAHGLGFEPVLGLLKIYKEHPELLAKEKKFRGRPDLIEYFSKNCSRFFESPDLFLMFRIDPDIFVKAGIDQISKIIQSVQKNEL